MSETWPAGVDPADYREIEEMRIDWTPARGGDPVRHRGRLEPDGEIHGGPVRPLPRGSELVLGETFTAPEAGWYQFGDGEPRLVGYPDSRHLSAADLEAMPSPDHRPRDNPYPDELDQLFCDECETLCSPGRPCQCCLDDGRPGGMLGR